MPELNKQCSQCNGTMAYRLGAYECMACGHAESAVAEPEPEARRSGPGFKPPSQFGAQQRQQPAQSDHGNYGPPPQAPPPQGTMHGGTGDLYGDPYGFAAPPPGEGSLRIEKNIYFGLTIAGSLLNLISQLVGSAASPYMGSPGLGGGGEIATSIFSGAIGLLILWWALYSTTVWVKWCCIVCELVNVLLIIVGAFFISYLMQNLLGTSMPPGTGGMVTAVVVISIIIAAAWAGWLVSILYRDVQRLDGRY